MVNFTILLVGLYRNFEYEYKNWCNISIYLFIYFIIFLFFIYFLLFWTFSICKYFNLRMYFPKLFCISVQLQKTHSFLLKGCENFLYWNTNVKIKIYNHYVYPYFFLECIISQLGNHSSELINVFGYSGLQHFFINEKCW